MSRLNPATAWAALSLCLAFFYSPASNATGCPIGTSAPPTGKCDITKGDWATTLKERSFNGGATIGGYYDMTLNITWLADANYAKTTGFSLPFGVMTWPTATGFVGSLNINGITGWRMPTMVDLGNDGCPASTYTGGGDCGYNVQTTTSEIAHLFYVSLGDLAVCPPGNATCTGPGVPQPGSGLTNTGPFLNMVSSGYWTNLEAVPPSPGSFAWAFDFGAGRQLVDFQNLANWAFAVHPGDVGVAPGPPDTDGDGVADSFDNCSLVANTSQLDANGDGYGNLCDADLNNSGIVTTADFGLLRSVLNQSAGSSATAAAADLNGSGTVTTSDFAILRARLNTVPGPSGLHPNCPPTCP